MQDRKHNTMQPNQKPSSRHPKLSTGLTNPTHAGHSAVRSSPSAWVCCLDAQTQNDNRNVVRRVSLHRQVHELTRQQLDVQRLGLAVQAQHLTLHIHGHTSMAESRYWWQPECKSVHLSQLNLSIKGDMHHQFINSHPYAQPDIVSESIFCAAATCAHLEHYKLFIHQYK